MKKTPIVPSEDHVKTNTSHGARISDDAMKLPNLDDSSEEESSVGSKTNHQEGQKKARLDSVAEPAGVDHEMLANPFTEADCEYENYQEHVLAPESNLHHGLDSSSIQEEPESSLIEAGESFMSNMQILRRFVQNGVRTKGLVGEALKSATLTIVSRSLKRPAIEMEPNKQEETQAKRRVQVDHAEKLAQKKTAECMALEKKLEESKARVASLTAANESLRKAAIASSEGMERTKEELQVARTNAANARAAADRAKRKMSSLASKVESFRAVVEKTERTTAELYEDHDRVSSEAGSARTKVLESELALECAQEKIQSLQEKIQSLTGEIQENQILKDEKEELENMTKAQQMELENFREEMKRRCADDKRREVKTQSLVNELDEANSRLHDARSATKEAKTTVTRRDETIQWLGAENKNLHEKYQKEHERLQTSLAKAEKETQALKTTHEAEAQKLRSDKESRDKQIGQLKLHIGRLERRLKDATSVVTPPPQTLEKESGALNVNNRFTIPPLMHVKENLPNLHGSVVASNKTGGCCLCNKKAVGRMKACQCGSQNCNKRAHVTCIDRNAGVLSRGSNGRSASRPRLILCNPQTK